MTWHRILHVMLFFAGLFGTAAWIRSLDAVPFSAAREKFQFLARELHRYDTLFIGSSRVFRGIVPEEFDRRAQELGHPTRSFNLGFAGLRPHDFDTLTDWVLEQRPSGLKRIVVELHAFDQGSRDGNWMTAFEIDMHSPAHLFERLESVLLFPRPLAEKVKVFTYVVAHTLTNTLRIGQGARLVNDLSARATRGSAPSRPVPEQGFAELATATAEASRVAQHHKWAAAPAQAEAMIAAKVKTPVPPRLVGGFNTRAFRAQVERIRAAGIEPIYVVMPQHSTNFVGRDALPAVAREAKVFAFDEPSSHAALYQFSFWFDADHFLRNGAGFFSRYLAECLVGNGENGVQPPPPAQVMPAPTLTARWLTQDRRIVEFRAAALPANGEVVVVVSLHAAQQDLGAGLKLFVQLPGVATMEMSRAADGTASASFDATALPADATLHTQLCVREHSRIVAASAGVTLAPR